MPLLQEALAALRSLEWGEWRDVPTREGGRRVRTARPTPGFWKLWQERKATVHAAGFSVGKDAAGEYVVSEWRKRDGTETERTLAARQEEATDTAAALAVPEVEINPAGLMAHQVDAVKRLVAALRAHNAALDASGTGVGKTYAGLSAALHLGGPVGVVCPKAVIPSWQRAFIHFGATPLFVQNYERLRQSANRWCSPRADRKGFEWSVPEGATLIFDEAHSAKAFPPTRNAWLLASAARQNIRTLLLSATLATGPQEMWASGRALKLYKGKFRDWLRELGCYQDAQHRWHNAAAGRGMAAIHRQLFPARGNRLRHEDIAGFPENLKIVEAWEFAENKEIAAVYSDMEVELAKLAARAERGRGKMEELVIMLRARQKTELLKVPAFAEQARLAVEEGRSVAVFLNFEDSVQALAQRLNCKRLIHGGQTPQARQAHIDAFARGEAKIIIANIRAGGVGISLHDTTGAHPRLALICPTFSAADLLQACGRCHRAGGGNVVTKIIFAAGTIEEQAMDAVQAKLARLDQLNDGELTPSSTFAPAPTGNAPQSLLPTA